MATFNRAVFLGIIVLFTGYLVNSTPANIPARGDKTREDDGAVHSEKEVPKSREDTQEEQRSKLSSWLVQPGVMFHSFCLVWIALSLLDL